MDKETTSTWWLFQNKALEKAFKLHIINTLGNGACGSTGQTLRHV